MYELLVHTAHDTIKSVAKEVCSVNTKMMVFLDGELKDLFDHEFILIRGHSNYFNSIDILVISDAIVNFHI